MIELDLKTHF